MAPCRTASWAAAYAKQEARKLAKPAKATVRALKKAGHAVARAAKAVAKAAYKYSGAEDVVGCVTHPSLAGCAKAALTVALTVGTAGEGEIAEIGLNAAEHAGEDLAADAGGGAARTLFHYTDEAGQKGILDSRQLNPSLKELNPRDARYGNGQYLSDIEPGTMTSNQLSRKFLNVPFQGAKFTHFVEIDVTGLNVIKGRAGVFVIRNEEPLDLTGRIVSSGTN